MAKLANQGTPNSTNHSATKPAAKTATKTTSPAKAESNGAPGQTLVAASAKLTAKNQTTIPTSVRVALGLEPLDRIKFEILSDGRVLLGKDSAADEDFDPAVLAYLDFIEADIIANPQLLSVLERDEELAKLLKGVSLDENFS